MTIWGVPGIFSQGERSTDDFLYELSSLGATDVRDAGLPVRNFITARWRWRTDARALAKRLGAGDAVVAHSYGCLRTCEALNYLVRQGLPAPRMVMLIAPAMSRGFRFDDIFDNNIAVTALVSRSDDAIKWGSRMLWHPFGDAGRKGFDDSRVVVHRADINDHNDYFNGDQIGRWARLFMEHYALASSSSGAAPPHR